MRYAIIVNERMTMQALQIVLEVIQPEFLFNNC